MDNTFVRGGHGDGSLPAFDNNHPAMRQIRAALLKAQARENGE